MSLHKIGSILLFLLFSFAAVLPVSAAQKQNISTFSIVGYDSSAQEWGVAVASRFFAVGNVVPWAKAGVGAVATQSFANTSFGWKGLELIKKGASAEEALNILIRNDDNPQRRQVGIVDKNGHSISYTGKNCVPWAGGRSGKSYALQGNILTSEDVVIAMEKAYLQTKGSLADRLYAALLAGDAKGGDSRGKQSAAMIVVKDKAGYGGYTDRAIDIRVDDHEAPFKELGRLLNIAQMNYAWNEGWTLFTQDKAQDALPAIERAAKIAPEHPEVLYDLAVIRLAAGDQRGALTALGKALHCNPKLKAQAGNDGDLKSLRALPQFKEMVK